LVLTKGSGTFKKWDLVEEISVSGAFSWTFYSFSFPVTITRADGSVMCFLPWQMLHHYTKAIMNWKLWNSEPKLTWTPLSFFISCIWS
jgi:hypothetical protein